ncbi:MAG: ATP-binding protein [Myxococcaceae bacterium]
MRLYHQLVLFMLAATVLPLAVVGFWLLRSAEDELARRIGGEQRALAGLAAREVSTGLMGAVEALGRATEAIDWSSASPEETLGGLSLLYQQDDAITAVALVDASGRLLSGPVYRAQRDDGHPVFLPEAQAQWFGAVPVTPLRGGQPGQAALGEAYVTAPDLPARVPVAVKAGSGEAAPFVLAELGLDVLEARMKAIEAEQGATIELLDRSGRVVFSPVSERRFGQLEPALRDRVARSGQDVAAESFSTSGPPRRLVSVAVVPGRLGFVALVSEEETQAFAPVAAMRRTVLFSIGGALAVLLAIGALFTRRLTRRIGQVVVGAEAYGRGELAHRISVTGLDELAGLAETFNRMGAELQGARTRLERWNDDLRQKVEEATAELKAAQAQLVEAQKLAAVGQLGAGVAHEINNPLTGILGNAQLLMLDRPETDPDFEMLRKIELSAKRCKEITQNLLRFSQQREKPEFRPVDLNGVVRDAISLTQHQLQGEGIAVSIELAEGDARINADPGHLSQVVLAVVSNARTALMKADRKELLLRTEVVDGEVRLVVRDSGKGIKSDHLPRIFEPFFTTKDVWSNVGLGLSVAYRVIREHQGRIEVVSTPGVGTTITLCLPLLAAKGAPAQTAA